MDAAAEFIEHLRDLTAENHGRDNVNQILALNLQAEELHMRSTRALGRAIDAWVEHHLNKEK